MLSSLAQQTQPGLIAVDAAHMPNNGKPSTEELRDLFSQHLHFKSSTWDNLDRFQYRGLVRNQQLQDCETEWLMFGDCDMVYHPEYFERLVAELQSKHATATYMLSSGRTSNPKEEANALVDLGVKDKAVIVANAFEQASELTKRSMKNVGAGFCQIINMRHCPHGGFYVKPTRNADWGWHKGSNPRSDIQFRRRVCRNGNARQSLPEWFSANAIHLNHDRDVEFGRHLTSQR